MTPAERLQHVQDAAYEFAPVYGFAHLDPALVVAQAKHETGNFTSDLVERANNAFGMKHPSRRETTSTGPNANGYATYDTLEDSVRDYFLRQRNFGIPDTSDAPTYIAATVASGYAEDPSYAGKWWNTYEAMEDMPQSESPQMASLLIPGAIIALLLIPTLVRK